MAEIALDRNQGGGLKGWFSVKLRAFLAKRGETVALPREMGRVQLTPYLRLI